MEGSWQESSAEGEFQAPVLPDQLRSRLEEDAPRMRLDDPEPPSYGAGTGFGERVKGVLFGPRGARWTSRILLIVLWQLAGLATDRFPTPLGTIQFLAEEFQRPFVRTEPWSVWNNELIRNTIISLARMGMDFLENCTPGYYNNEGKPGERSGQNGFYGGGSVAFFKVLQDWREAGGLKGLELR